MMRYVGPQGVAAVQPPAAPPLVWSEPTPLPPDRPISIAFPAVSPRGTRLAYVKNGQLWIADLPGEGSRVPGLPLSE